jgi:ABC-type amino acid transport substrate-binding protein
LRSSYASIKTFEVSLHTMSITSKLKLPPLGAVALTLFCCASAFSSTLDRIKETQTIVIAYRDSSSPFSYLPRDPKAAAQPARPAASGPAQPNFPKSANEGPVPLGYSIDICNRLAEAIKTNLGLKK